jgi:biotin transport system substrate-specific component
MYAYKADYPTSDGSRQTTTPKRKMHLNVAMMTRTALMAAVTAVAAQMAIPLPFSPVPFTLQVLAVILSGLLLGSRYGALAQAIYVLVGAVGVPVFARFSGGLGVVLGPTGGYLFSYPLAAAIAGLAAHTAVNATRRKALWASFLWGCTGLAVIYVLGATWLAVITRLPFAAALAQGVLPFVPFDLIKVAIAALVAIATAPAIASSRA